MTAGIPQKMKTHCQPTMPRRGGLPLYPIVMIRSEIGGPMIAASGVPMKNQASVLVRSRLGNQWVK